jgi:GNAT superfamily N-acetyltransferase
MDITIRAGKAEDVPEVLALIKELALYERAPEAVITTEAQLLADGFGAQPLYHLLVAEYQGRLVGLALSYYRYSTWKGKCLYLEDLYVQEAYRRLGLGERFFEALLQKARTEACQRLCWQVLDWNTPAIEFYKKLGATLDAEWVNGYLEV